MGLLTRTLVFVHRYVGIPLSAIFIVWFVSGIVMMYAGGMPAITAESRLAALPPLDLAAVRLSPLEAAQRADVAATGGRTTLVNVLERPAYRFSRGPRTTTVFADDGTQPGELNVEQSRLVAARFAGVAPDKVSFLHTADSADQWTLTARRDFPLHKFRIDDGAGTEAYVSPRNAEVSVLTTTKSRTLAWLGTIPHWFYFTPLRTNQPLWYWTVVWMSVAGCVLAVIGLVLGLVKFRRTKPFNLSASIPYRGWMRWHYISGIVFGVFALTWVFSGLMSMEPFEWMNAEGLQVRRDAFTGGPVDLAQYPAFDAAAWRAATDNRELKELELTRIQDAPYYIARFSRPPGFEEGKRERLHQPYIVSGRNQPQRLLIAVDGLQARTDIFDVEGLLTRLRTAAPDANMLEHELLTDYDSYYYSRNGQAALPVLRVKFDDPLETWVYIDPTMSQVVGELHRLARLERWLFNGLHSLDFKFWYDKRPLWDIGMILLSLGALTSSTIGLWLGLKRMARALRRRPANANA